MQTKENVPSIEYEIYVDEVEVDMLFNLYFATHLNEIL